MNTTSTTLKTVTRHNYCNVVKLEIHQNDNAFDLKIENSRGQSDHVYFSNNDKELIIEQITSDNPHCIWFDDISYHIRFYRSGMKVIHLYQHEQVESIYTFDTSVIVDWINNPDENIPTWQWILDKDWYDLYRDKITADIDKDIFKVYRNMIVRSRMGDKAASEFIQLFKNICQWGLCSNLVYLSISFDGYNEKDKLYPSLYWQVSSIEHKRLINGGLIFHHDWKDAHYLETGEYSIHT
jgi:hypothetical protein